MHQKDASLGSHYASYIPNDLPGIDEKTRIHAARSLNLSQHAFGKRLGVSARACRAGNGAQQSPPETYTSN
jgi:hypothetical protein